ncbi:MAG: hypothetical protein GY792_21970 [Gammaproteobacteria bacterium]|nr:hypothetical protein [Gammaproteobacteria bacterium]
MKSAIVFDVDNTLTPPRQALREEMAHALINFTRHFVLAAGSDLTLVQDQFLEPLHKYGFRRELDAFLCNGASRYHCVFDDRLIIRYTDEFSLRAHLGDARFDKLLQLLQTIRESPQLQLPSTIEIVGSQIINRGSMLNFAPSGRPRGALSELAQQSRNQFVEFDRSTGYRRQLLTWLRAEINRILPGNDLAISLGGETSFDIVVRGREKTYPVRTLLNEGYDKVTYVGDALFPGGNDEAVAEFAKSWPNSDCPIRVVQVNNYEETISLILNDKL